jgi:CBS-domain-containing membrane protein
MLPLVRVVDQLIRRRAKALPVVDGEQRVLGIVTGVTCNGAVIWVCASAGGTC